MSREERPRKCDACRERAFEYRRGDLSERDREGVDEHLADCAACREYFDRVDALIGSAREFDPAPGSADSDAMFEGIADRIEENANDTQGAPGESGGSVRQPTTAGVGWGRYAAVAAAALFAGIVLGAILSQVSRGDRASPSVAATGDAGSRDRGRRMAGAGEEASEASGEPESAFAHLREVRSGDSDRESGGSVRESGGSVRDAGAGESGRDVRIFASPDAEWSLEGERDARLQLDRGRVLVEFLPDGTKSLRVRAPGFDVRVTGTVFFVSADRDSPRAGVLTGEIEVEPESGETVRVGADEEVRSDFERRRMPDSRRERLGRYVDLEEHRRRLETRAAAEGDERRIQEPRASASGSRTGEAEKPSGAGTAPAAEERARDDRRDRPTRDASENLEALRRRADRAAAKGDFDESASRYREFLDRAAPDDPGVGPVHLDLANLYIHRLDAPARAVPHLKTYVRRWPNDVATPSVREELCRITRNLERLEPHCE